MTSGKQIHMEVDVSLPEPLPAPAAVPDDGALGDDEHTDKEARAPVSVTPMERSPPSDEKPEPRERTESFNSTGGGDVNGRKKKHRRGKHKGGRRHRHWKPYTKMTWEEKKELEERETKRACKKREERFASGQPMAPYNTTQFLMEQHQHSDVNLKDSRPRLNKPEVVQDGGGSGGGSGSGDGSSEEYYSSPDDEEIFLEKEFTEAYENYHAERLQTMTKEELVREYLELESKVDTMEKKRKEESKTNGRLSSSAISVTSIADDNTTSNLQGPPSPKGLKLTISPKKTPTAVGTEESTVSTMQQEINRLRQENETLRQENALLRQSQLSNSVNEGEP